MQNKRLLELKKDLDNFGQEYEIIKHPPIQTVEEGLRFLNIGAEDGVSTLVFKADGKFIVVFRRDDHHLDTNKIKKHLKISNLEMATPEEILEKTGGPKGATPMITNLFSLMDKTILERKFVYGGTGSFEHDLKIDPRVLQQITQAEAGDFVKVGSIQRGKKRVLSGIRATGRLHLGNYLGAVKGFLELQADSEYECLYMVADLHTITTPYKIEELRKNRREVVIDYLAAGLDPQKSIIFEQSDSFHAELAFYLSSAVSIARMQHLPTFKDKVKQYPEHSTMALLNYPILMAADILIYKAGLVPVGIDQEPHLEIAREIARKMNDMYGTNFPEPVRFATKGEYIPSLSGEGKMSKSVEGSFINLTDSLETIKQRLSSAPTDGGCGEKIPTIGGVANLLKFVELFQGEKTRKEYEKQYTSNGIKYSELKIELAEAIFDELKPIQEKRKYFEDNPEKVEKIIKEGAEKARVIAKDTIEEVKQKMGFK